MDMDFDKEESRINIPNESNLGMDYNASTTTNNWLQQSSGINNGGVLESSSENMLNTSPLSNSSNGGNVEMRSNDSGDAEGVWSPDIDQAFHEALQIYPPCGRRKIILSDEGKMYGRNELIARYIKIRCGKTRTRKQVSSHIQVLARKKQREEQARIKAHRDGNNLTDASNLLANNPTNSANGSISPMVPHGSDEVGGNHSAEMELFQTTAAAADLDPAKPLANLITSVNRNQITSMQAQMLKAASAITMGANPSWPYNLQANNLLGLNNQLNSSQLFMANGTPLNSVQTDGLTASTSTVLNNLIASSRLSLIEFSAYITKNLKAEEDRDGFDKTEIVHISKISDAPLERISIDLIQSKYPPILQELFKKGPADAFFLAKCWANMNFDNSDEQNSLFAVDSFYESAEKFDITVSTKVCSFGNEVVEKVEVYSPTNDDVDEKSATGNVWHFKLNRSPMCEYMVRFISELKKLTEPALMNSVLENFTVLQIVTNKMTDETLMVLAFIFDIREDGEDEIYTNVYRLTDESN